MGAEQNALRSSLTLFLFEVPGLVLPSALHLSLGSAPPRPESPDAWCKAARGESVQGGPLFLATTVILRRPVPLMSWVERSSVQGGHRGARRLREVRVPAGNRGRGLRALSPDHSVLLPGAGGAFGLAALPANQGPGPPKSLGAT